MDFSYDAIAKKAKQKAATNPDVGGITATDPATRYAQSALQGSINAGTAPVGSAKTRSESKPATRQKPEVQEEVKETPKETEVSEEAKLPDETVKEEVVAPNLYADKSAKIGKYLAVSLIRAYKDNQFGNIYEGKKNSELTPEERAERKRARSTLGHYILDEIGTRLANFGRGFRGQDLIDSDWSKQRSENENVNASIRAYEAQYNAAKEEVLSTMSEQERANLTPAEMDSKVLQLLQRKGVVAPQTKEGVYTTTSGVAETETKKAEFEVKALDQQQRQTATSNLTALLARKEELQKLIADLEADRGWDAYAKAMDALVGTARGLESAGLIQNASQSLTTGSRFNISGGVSASLPKLASADLAGAYARDKQKATSTGKTDTLSKDALAYSVYKDRAQYDSETSRESRVAENRKLAASLWSQVELIDKLIQTWGKDLGVGDGN